METYLETYFEEVTPRMFYREIFPEGELDEKDKMTPGKYTGVIVSVTREKKADGKPKIKRYTVTDDLEAIDKACEGNDFCLMSPISYAGKSRTADRARFLYAFAVDLDRIRYRDDGSPLGLSNLWENHIVKLDRIPKPTFIVSSGTGLHLYYVLKEPIALFQNVSKKLQGFKRDLTSLIWHDTIVDIKSSNEVQQEGIYQGFRIPGTITKTGSRARVFRVGDKTTVEALEEYTAGFREHREGIGKYLVKKKEVTLKKAKELYPEWYERRVVRKEPRGAWHVSRAVYEWWKTEIKKAQVGHRYYCIMMLAIYARKCSMYDAKHNPDPVTREELERDAFGLFDFMEGMTEDEKNHFTTADILDALEAFNDKWITFPREEVEVKSGIRIKINKRNGRKQSLHLKLARTTQAVLDEETGRSWRAGTGRKSKEFEVLNWRRTHPGGNKSECARDLGVSRPTVHRPWNAGKRFIVRNDYEKTHASTQGGPDPAGPGGEVMAKCIKGPAGELLQHGLQNSQ